MAGVYAPRSPTTGVLYGVVRAHLTDFLAMVAARTDGIGLQAFVTAELRKFLRCGVLAHGIARVRCEACAFERLVPFSCKGRGFCPSCGGRRMTERAAHPVEHVVPPGVPVRQWVLSVPHRLGYRLAYDHRLCRRVRGVFVRALRAAYRRQARRHGLAGGETGLVTSVQRFGGALNLHVHFHTLVLDGVFVRAADGTLPFHPAPPPTDAAVRQVILSMSTQSRNVRLSPAGRNRTFALGAYIPGLSFLSTPCRSGSTSTRYPYAEMWADDHLWIPHLLAGRHFAGRYVFDGDAMLDHALDVGGDVPAPPAGRV